MNNEFDSKSIADRIKKLRKEKKFSQNFVAEKLSITQAGYSRIENCNKSIGAEHIIRLSGLFEVTADFLLKGNNSAIIVSPKTGFSPLIRAKAHAGFVENFNERIDFDDKDWFRIPGFNASLDYRLFEIEGESMVPTLFPRDIVVCQVQNDIRKLLSGSLVIVVTRKEVLAKRFEKIEKGKIFLQNENQEYPQQQMELQLSEIQQVLNIHGKITSALVPHHRIFSNTKVKEFEETIELLKKEIFQLSKKVQSISKKN